MNYLLNYNFLKYIITLVIVLFPLSVHAQGQTIVLSNGKVFTDCQSALKYRDGALFKKFERKFVEYDIIKEARIKKALSEMRTTKIAAQKLIRKAGDEQARIIVVAFSSYVTGELVERLVKKIKPITEKEKQVLKTVLKSAGELSIEAGNQLTGGKVDNMKIAADRARSLVKTVQEAAYILPKSIQLAVDVLDASIKSVDVTFAYLGKELDIELARNEIKNVDKAIARLFRSSNSKAIGMINKVNSEIDKACR